MRKVVLLTVVLSMVSTLNTMAETPSNKNNIIKENSDKFWEQVMKTAPSITVNELKALTDDKDANFLLLDVRTLEEYNQGHISNAIYANRNFIEWFTPQITQDPNIQIYVYCQVGARGADATLSLLELGYKKVSNVRGGIQEWANAGYPVYNKMGEFIFTKNGFVNFIPEE